MLSKALKVAFGDFSGNYGHDQIVRKLLRLPEWFRINATIQHGWYADVHEPDLVRKGAYFVWNSRLLNKVKERKRDCYISGSPFILYRHSSGIEVSPDAKGTVAFPQHSTPNTFCVFDFEKYCQQLNDLPDKYKPITICLHFRDLEGLASKFERKGFDVVSAGDGRAENLEFVKGFYKILGSHKYATSNDVGTYLFYSVEMGIPFFLVGGAVSFHNKNTGSLEFEERFTDPVLKKVFKMFSGGCSDKITIEQRAFVESELGIYDKISIKELKKILLFRFFILELPLSFFRIFSFVIKKSVNQFKW